MKYGVRRLVAINSGGFIYAELDLRGAIHLAAPNNAGKSTLVNALQYLYVDDIQKMAFAKTVDETKEHYFGEDRSYLIYECATPSGIQTLLVRGLGSLRACGFERYVYSGPYRRDDFEEEGGVVREFDSVKGLLADRNLLEVPQTHLWEVLTGQVPIKGKPLPSLGILPLRSRQEYRSFREVFVKLLALTDASARDLKRLIITCHAHELGETKIDVAATYKDMFDRAVRSEEEYRFIHDISHHIMHGRNLRTEIAELRKTLREQAPRLWSQAAALGRLLLERKVALEEQRGVLVKDVAAKESQRNNLYLQQGSQVGELKQANAEDARLNAAHNEWSAYSPEMIRALRENLDSLADDISRVRANLRQTQSLDLEAMRKHVEELKRRVEGDHLLLEQIERAAAAVLLDRGMSKIELDAAFRVLNPSLARQIVGEAVEVRNEATLLSRIRALADRVREGTYQDDAVSVDLGAVDGPDLETILNREQLRNTLTLLGQELKTASERLDIARHAEQARQSLVDKQRKHKEIQESLSRYDRYCEDWANRAQLKLKIEQTENAVADTEARIAELDKDIVEARRLEQGTHEEEKRIQNSHASIIARSGELQNAAQGLHIDLAGVRESEEEAPDGVAGVADILVAVQQVVARIQQWLQRAQSLAQRQADLDEVERQIEAASIETRTHRMYFEETTWEDLIQKQEAMAEREQVVRKEWDDLFTLLRSNLKLMLTGLQHVKAAVHRMNRELVSYKVSNLRGVELAVEHRHTSYEDIVALTQEGTLFEDRDSIEMAKNRLRTMIETGQVIELLELFGIRIRVFENDGSTSEAKSLDDIGSTGTGMTAKAMVFVQLVRALLGKKDYGLHFYLDETGQLDDSNLKATTAMAISKGMVPITAEPSVRMEPLAHPAVTVYSLGAHNGRFCIDRYQTYHARRNGPPQGYPEVVDASN